MTKVNTLIFSGYGLNCEEETKIAFEMAGGAPDIVHINDIIAKPALLKRYQIVAFPGGFSYGDDTGSGKAFGNRLKAHLGADIEKFLTRDTLMIGICNGFQILTAAGILPGALMANDAPRFLVRWTDVEVKGKSPWLSGIERLSLPIAHGEGKYYAPKETLNQLKRSGHIGLTYVSGKMCEHFGLPANPTGTLENIAGITAHGGRVLGLMPHPERAVRFTQLPQWTLLKERCIRTGESLPPEGPGLQVFKNAVSYFA